MPPKTVTILEGVLERGQFITRNPRTIDPQKCPHFILVGNHYRGDGTCKCDDPNETVMREWGYKWNKRLNQWRG